MGYISQKEYSKIYEIINTFQNNFICHQASYLFPIKTIDLFYTFLERDLEELSHILLF